MRMLTVAGGTAACVLAMATMARPQAADCRSLGNVQFVCGQAGPEDLAVVPGGQWVIASGYVTGAGSIRLINTRDNSTNNETWGFGTTAVQVGRELWVGAVRGERIARFQFP